MNRVVLIKRDYDARKRNNSSCTYTSVSLRSRMRVIPREQELEPKEKELVRTPKNMGYDYEVRRTRR